MAWKVINEARIVKDDVTGAVGIHTGSPDVAVIGEGGSTSGYSNGVKFKVPLERNLVSSEARNPINRVVLEIEIMIAVKDDGTWQDFWGGKLSDIVNFEELLLMGEDVVFSLFPYNLIEISANVDDTTVCVPLSYLDADVIGLPLTSSSVTIVTRTAYGVPYAMLRIYNVYDASDIGDAKSLVESINDLLSLITHITFPVTVYTTIESEANEHVLSNI